MFMKNDEIFKLATLVARGLKASGHINNINKAKGQIYKVLAPTLCSEVITKDEDLDWDMSDPELRVEVKKLLMRKLKSGSLTGADIGQFKDIFGLADATSDLVIEVVDYKDVCPECERRADEAEVKDGG